MSPLNEKAFEKLVRSYGCSITQSTKHHKVIDIDGLLLMPFAIHHSKGSKRQVLDVYVRQFLKKMKETNREPK